jgi:spermidine synthase
MWADAFRRVSYHTPRVLLLGLGAGGSIPLLHKQFYNCDITAVEHDPAMVALTRTVGAYKPFPFPYVVEEDASTAVHQLSGLFDIIIIDLFNGPEPSLLATDKAFLQALKKLLSHTGTLLINVYKRPKYLHTARTLFLKANEWKFAENTLGSFTDNV